MADPIVSQLTQFLAYRQARVSRLSHSNRKALLVAFVRETGIRNLDEVDFPLLQAWVERKQMTVRLVTLHSYASWLSVFFNWGIKSGFLNENPVHQLDLPKAHKAFRTRFLSKEIVQRLLASCDDLELQYCLYCGFHAGLRFAEVVMSQPHWFDLRCGVLHVTQSETWYTKDKQDRTIPLTEAFAKFLAGYRFQYPYMIGPHKQTGKIYRYTFRRRFKRYVKDQSVTMTFHDCRRTFASLHVQSGTSIYKVAKWLGDGLAVTERHYGHLVLADPEINRAFV